MELPHTTKKLTDALKKAAEAKNKRYVVGSKNPNGTVSYYILFSK